MKAQWVYIAQSKCLRFAKVGLTVAPERRLIELSGNAADIFGRNAPRRWHMLAVIPGNRQIEKDLIYRLSAYRARAVEWLKCSDEVLRMAELLASRGSYPYEVPPAPPRIPVVHRKDCKHMAAFRLPRRIVAMIRKIAARDRMSQAQVVERAVMEWRQK